MKRIAVVVCALALAACKSPEQMPGLGARAADAAPSTATVASADASAAAVDAEVLAFCVAAIKRNLQCLDDDAFWDVFATVFFAQQGGAVDADAKRLWIGMQKDSTVAIARSNEYEQNCKAMIGENRLPTKEDMQVVTATFSKSCAESGTALGLLIFQKGVFFQPR